MSPVNEIRNNNNINDHLHNYAHKRSLKEIDLDNYIEMMIQEST